MKKLSSIILGIFMISILLSFSACSNDIKKYSYYYFNEELGEFVNSENVGVGLDTKNKEMIFSYPISDEKYSATFDNGEAKLQKGAETEKFYFNDYYFVSEKSMLGSATMNEAKELTGIGQFNGEKCTYIKGKIINEKNNEVGKYEINNNYITINYDGKASELLMFTMAKNADEKEKTVGFFKDFYTSTRVVSTKIENTGFEIDTKTVINDNNGKININFFQKEYVPQVVTYKVIDNGGFNFRIDDGGNYFYNSCEKETREKIVISITADGLEKKFELKPLFFKINKEQMYLRYVDESVDFNDMSLFVIKGFDLENLTYSINVVDGMDAVTVADKVVSFSNSGYVVIEVTAKILDESISYEMKDRISINISGKKIEKK